MSALHCLELLIFYAINHVFTAACRNQNTVSISYIEANIHVNSDAMRRDRVGQDYLGDYYFSFFRYDMKN